jgi:hypothetical protein
MAHSFLHDREFACDHRVVEVPWRWAPRIAVYAGSAASRCTARFGSDCTFDGLQILSSDMALRGWFESYPRGVHHPTFELGISEIETCTLC